jgi:hypothetical protein
VTPNATRLPRWLAAVPGLVIATIFAGRAFVQMGQAARAVSGDNASKPQKSLTCLDIYAMSLSNSEDYVPEGQQFVPRQTREISTVLSGMVQNNCGEPLKSVTIHMTVHDDAGRQGSGSVSVAELNPGEAKSFKKAWMGRVTSYEIGKIQ